MVAYRATDLIPQSAPTLEISGQFILWHAMRKDVDRATDAVDIVTNYTWHLKAGIRRYLDTTIVPVESFTLISLLVKTDVSKFTTKLQRGIMRRLNSDELIQFKNFSMALFYVADMTVRLMHLNEFMNERTASGLITLWTRCFRSLQKK